MSWILDWSLYIGMNESQFVRSLEAACVNLDLRLTLQPSNEMPPKAVALRWAADKGGVAVLNPSRPGKKGVALSRQIADLSQCYWIWAQAWEGSVWYYYLRRGTETVDAYHVSKGFCKANDYSPVLWKPQSPEFHSEQLARVCRIDRASILKYFRDWGYTETDDGVCAYELDEKAYPDDRSPYGDGAQLWDLLRKLGFSEPLWNRGYYLDPGV